MAWGLWVSDVMQMRTQRASAPHLCYISADPDPFLPSLERVEAQWALAS